MFDQTGSYIEEKNPELIWITQQIVKGLLRLVEKFDSHIFEETKYFISQIRDREIRERYQADLNNL
jgi:hypothetical protein